MAFVQSEWSS